MNYYIVFNDYIQEIANNGVWGIRENTRRYKENVKNMSPAPITEMQHNMFDLIIDQLQVKNPPDLNGETPLHLAVQNNDLEMCRNLTNSGLLSDPET